ncbi:MAG TPA: VgrG-related protein [Micromonosporaceae bacterium]|nr:VgrG-related protein [Micromonosporaceae bacterium]
MVANESFANSLVVEIEGQPLADDVKSLLVYCYVDDSRNLPDAFMLRFRDPGSQVLTKANVTVGAKIVLKVQTADPGGPQPLMTGEVTAVGFALDETGTFTEVRGYDKAHRLFRGRRTVAYPNMSLSDVVRKIGQRANLELGDIDNVSGFAGQQDTQISQDNVSDWEMLCRLAAAVGAQTGVADGKLFFKLPDAPSGAPSTSSKATSDPLVLEAHRNLVSLRASITAAEQVPSVEVRGWDVQNKQALSATSTPNIAGTELNGTDPVDLANKFGAPNFVAVDRPYRVQAEVQASADAFAAQIGGACAELEGIARGNPNLRAGTAVTLANVGDTFAGKYTLTGTRHLFDEHVGYTTSFTVSGRQERSLYGLATGGGGGGGVGGHRIYGVVTGIVSDVKDPSKMGRVKLNLPWMGADFTTGWARVIAAGAGDQRGFLVLPEVGDEVVVAFEHGDIDYPYVVGNVWNGKDAPPTLSTDAIDGGSGEIAARAFVSRKGHKLEFVETDGITLTSGDGSVTIKLDSKNQKIQITSGKTIEVKGPNGITFDSGSGAIEFKGQGLKLTSTGDYELSATGQLKLSGNAGVKVDGPTINIAATADAELTSNGVLTVRGTMVKIN